MGKLCSGAAEIGELLGDFGRIRKSHYGNQRNLPTFNTLMLIFNHK